MSHIQAQKRRSLNKGYEVTEWGWESLGALYHGFIYTEERWRRELFLDDGNLKGVKCNLTHNHCGENSQVLSSSF